MFYKQLPPRPLLSSLCHAVSSVFPFPNSVLSNFYKICCRYINIRVVWYVSARVNSASSLISIIPVLSSVLFLLSICVSFFSDVFSELNYSCCPSPAPCIFRTPLYNSLKAQAADVGLLRIKPLSDFNEPSFDPSECFSSHAFSQRSFLSKVQASWYIISFTAPGMQQLPLCCLPPWFFLIFFSPSDDWLNDWFDTKRMHLCPLWFIMIDFFVPSYWVVW